jgi:hypothetical protein
LAPAAKLIHNEDLSGVCSFASAFARTAAGTISLSAQTHLIAMQQLTFSSFLNIDPPQLPIRRLRPLIRRAKSLVS